MASSQRDQASQQARQDRSDTATLPSASGVPVPAAITVSAADPPAPSLPRSRTGLHIRTRAIRALNGATVETSRQGDPDVASVVIVPSNPNNILASDVASTASSSTSTDSGYTHATNSSAEGAAASARSLGRHLRNKSASLISGLAAASISSPSLASTGGDRSPLSIRSEESAGRRLRLNEHLRIPRRQMSSYTPSYSSKGVNNDEYRKHNLFPLPPPGHVRPILLPAHAVITSTASSAPRSSEAEDELRIRIDGFVEQWPDRVGTGQRVFMQLARQMANLPRLPRQQPSSLSSNASRTNTGRDDDKTPSAVNRLSEPMQSSYSFSMSAPTTPLHADTDDAIFFPEMPYGVPRKPTSSTAADEDDHDHEAYGGEKERPGDKLARHALALGAPERTIGRVLQGLGALPVEGEPWSSQMIDAMKDAQHDVDDANRAGAADAAESNSSASTGMPGAGPLGGSSFWANRSRDDVERLWRTLEHRLRCFWTYRKPFQEVIIEVIPQFEKNEAKPTLDWVTDEYDVSTDPTEARNGANDSVSLLAVTDITSDANGLFSTHLSIPHSKLQHYFQTYHGNEAGRQSAHDVRTISMRARMITDAGRVVQTPWQTVDVVHDNPSNVHVICDIDDTAKHTHVLGGARAVARNVFARPFEEVVVPGVQRWFSHLSGRNASEEREEDVTVSSASSPLISGWHYVTNAPAEMHAITKAYLATAALPAGSLLLKHYFSPRGGSSLAWLQSLMQPASTRKKNNLLRCVDDFSQSQFILVGDSGEQDLDVYCELARMRPEQVRAIWIRNVGNVSALAKGLANARMGKEVEAPSDGRQTDRTPKQPSADVSAASGIKSSTPKQAGGQQDRLASSSTSTSSTSTGPATSDEFLLRLQRNLNTLPPSVTLQFWETGDDAIEESIRQVRRMKGGDGVTL